MRTATLSFGLVGLAMAALAPMAIGQIAVNESSFGGDFNPGLGSPTNITPALGLGVNTITGSVGGIGFSADALDIFRVTLPAGTSISSISLTASNWVSSTPSDLARYELLFAPSNTGARNFLANGTYPLTFNLGNPNDIAFRVGSPRDEFGASSGSFDYVLNLTVVPTPGATAMLGMGALAAARRRR